MARSKASVESESPKGLLRSSAYQLIIPEHEIRAGSQPLNDQIDETAHSGRLGCTTAVVDEQIEVVGHMLQEQRHKAP